MESFSLPFWMEKDFLEYVQCLEVREPDRGEFLLFEFDPETHEVVCSYDVEADCQADGFVVTSCKTFTMLWENFTRLVEAVNDSRHITLRNGHTKIRGRPDGEGYNIDFLVE